MIEEEVLIKRVRAILDEDSFVLLAQELGGTRVYLPLKLSDDHDVIGAIGRTAAEALVRELAPAWLRVPLARRERALYWRARGLSNARIARKVGMSETGVEKLFRREEDLPPKPSSGRQLQLL